MEKVFDYGDLKLEGKDIYGVLEKMKTQDTPTEILLEQLNKGFYTMEGGSETQYIMFMRVKDMIVYFMSRYHTDSAVSMIAQTPEGQKMLEESRKDTKKYSALLNGILSNPKSHGVISKLTEGVLSIARKAKENATPETNIDLKYLYEMDDNTFAGIALEIMFALHPDTIEKNTKFSHIIMYDDVYEFFTTISLDPANFKPRNPEGENNDSK